LDHECQTDQRTTCDDKRCGTTEDRCLSAPAAIKGAALIQVGVKLAKLGLAREIGAKPGAPIWRRDDAEKVYALKLTAAGFKAIPVDGGEQRIDASDGLQRNRRDRRRTLDARRVRGDVGQFEEIATRVAPSLDDRAGLSVRKIEAIVAVERVGLRARMPRKCRAYLGTRKSRRFARTSWWSCGDSNP
jgi:hypothetical protein